MSEMSHILPVVGPWAILAALCIWLIRTGKIDRLRFLEAEKQRKQEEADRNKKVEDLLKKAGESQPAATAALSSTSRR